MAAFPPRRRRSKFFIPRAGLVSYKRCDIDCPPRTLIDESGNDYGRAFEEGMDQLSCEQR